jgi:putative DNA methylase
LGVEQAAKMLVGLGHWSHGTARQADAQSQEIAVSKVVSTDPPYYDNIGYADLSDFFYVWLRRTLKPTLPELFATLAVPKAEELVATPYRHGSKQKAETFFLNGMTQAMHRLAEQAHLAFPVTIYYAFKQAESDGADGTTNTGWDTFLAAVIEGRVRHHRHLANDGQSWRDGHYLKKSMSALASSIVLVCRQRSGNAPTATRRDFVTALKAELPPGTGASAAPATSPLWTWRKQRLVPAWPSIRVTPGYSMLKASRSPCAPPWR